MKIKYLKLKNWLLVTLGGMLGVNFAGCDEILSPTCEYGTPEATYHVKGTVTNANGQPIPGIGVRIYDPWGEEPDTTMSSIYSDTTDAEGRYSVIFERSFPGSTLPLKFNDIDGEANGSYLDTVVYISTDNVQTNGGDGWYEGEGIITQDVVLKEKTDK